MHKSTGKNHPQFNKVFEFQKSPDWRLPETVYSSPTFKIQKLQDMKRELNTVKGKLSQFDLAEWSSHTQRRDLAGYVIGQLKKKIRPELLTQAWCKFYEILNKFPVIDDNLQYLKTLHLCEAPGAFVCALNHYLVKNHPDTIWEWQANTLNPYYEGNSHSHMIADHRLISHTQNHWLFGLDETGDLLQYYNHEDIVRKINSKGKVNLVTADGSINCMSDPGEQETLVGFLHYCETLTALAVLEKRGSFVLKIFTVFENSTLCLLYLLNCAFDKTFLFKPATSKSGNSEVYLICLGYNGFDMLSPLWHNLTIPYHNGFFQPNLSMFSVLEIPENFIYQVNTACTNFFLERQISTINDNIHFYLCPNEEDQYNLHNCKIQIANLYIQIYRLSAINKKYRIVPYFNVHWKLQSERSNIKQILCLKDCNVLDYISIKLGKRINFVNTTNFASTKVLDELMLYLKNYEITRKRTAESLYNKAMNKLSKSVITININSFTLTPYYLYQKKLLFSFKTAIQHRKHIFLINIPIHTHFLAALWCIIGSLFETIYCGPGWCLFYSCIETKLNIVNNLLSDFENVYENTSHRTFYCDIINLFPSNLFCNDLNYVTQFLNVYNTFQIPIYEQKVIEYSGEFS
ncbi:cap-specific mRNA (nucleoside-2'-O-)-methyltransferase 2 [Euwallacea fornicatus]|uniref:cap-specific mRNA (nucleoside-2'-O-)-methyltransferase 2 n=1 Tax=Euwallacea fornicatus TaxID=995702 RepID=UPI00339034D9